MGLLTKIFGNRDDTDAPLGEGSDESSPERETIEIEPLPATDEPQATPERGRLTFAAPSSGSPPPERGDDSPAGGRRKQRRASRTGSNGGRQRQREVTRGKIARPTVSTFDAPGNPLPIPLDASRARPSGPRASAGGASGAATGSRASAGSATGGSSATQSSASEASAPLDSSARGNTPSKGPEADDPEEIDVSDQLDEVDADEDLDASEHLIIEDDAPQPASGDGSEDASDEEEDEERTSVAIWGSGNAAGPVPSAPSEPAAERATEAIVNPAPSPELTPATQTIDPSKHEERAEGSSSAAASLGAPRADTYQPDPEWTRMAADTKTPKQTIIEVGTEFTGTLKSSCPVVVNGKLEGEVDAPTLSIATTGAVLGTIRAQTLRSFGTLAGNVDAGEVYVSGAVRSKTVIKAKRLEAKLGSPDKGSLEVTFGNCDLAVADTPSEPSNGRTSTPGASDTSGSTGWDLPEADSRVVPARAGAGGERVRSK